jgi:predicted nucleotidyltransferase component of viral defense system
VIPREEILESAKDKRLIADVVEKDYVLGWLLMGIARHPVLRGWVFKGGTCLKKCFFETYRFSEDLDFTVPDGMVYNADAYRGALIECAATITEETGIQLPEAEIEIKESHDKADRKTFLGKISYRGPLMSQTGTLPRIRIDLTKHEVIVEEPEARPIRHFYSDAPEPTVPILCYTVNEILAEKTRALYERQGRARDLYDVVNISRNHREEIEPHRAVVVLKEKFQFKALTLPTLDGFISSIDFQILEANLDQQLRHQLPALPPVKSYLEELRESALLWMEARPFIEEPARIPVSAGDVVVPRTPFPQMGQGGVPASVATGRGTAGGRGALEQIRYAARNRLCTEVMYHGVRRLTEPYSLRTRGTGNLILYVHEILRGGAPSGLTKAYKVAEIQGANVTEQSFRPRYAVEL